MPLTEPGFKGAVGAAAIHLSPDGRFLYATNRGDANEIVIFSVDPANGHLKKIGHQSSLGKSPREFAIDPTGNWLIVGNQNSDTVYVFKRDQQSGLLEANPKRIRDRLAGGFQAGVAVVSRWLVRVMLTRACE